MAATQRHHLENLVVFVCLLYHEARNVRWPIKQGLVCNPEKYVKLVSLPRNRYDAWKCMAKVRTRALRAPTAGDVVAVFREQHGLSLDELLQLYQAPFWKDSTSVGGNKWGAITAKVRDLVQSYDAANERRTGQLVDELLQMEHNTGLVEKKLQDLER